MRDWLVPIAIIAFFAAVMGDGLYNDHKFSSRCARAGGIATMYNTACVKPGSILFTSN